MYILLCYCTVVIIGVASYGALGHVPLLELTHVHQFGNFYLRTTPAGSDRLLVNTRFPVPATDSQSLKLA